MFLRKRDKILVAASSLLFGIMFIVGWLLVHQAIYFLALAGMLGALMIIQTVFYIETQREFQQPNANYRQIESLFYLFSTLKFKHPLPSMRVWAISPDFANIVISLIRECRPKLVLEIGSGVSTLISAYCLKENKEGVIVSLDHDKQFAALSAANVAKHGLQDITTVHYAPLKEVIINDKSWLWYEMKQLQNLKSIDMLIIDGPPDRTQRLARYPALPILFSLLSDDAVILLDDANRPDETEIVKRWIKDFHDFSLEIIDTEKGTAILRRKH
jgi:predicted O-methyltransferase YrrM